MNLFSNNIHEFVDKMPDELKCCMQEMISDNPFIDFFPTGSRYICPDFVENNEEWKKYSDWDVFCLYDDCLTTYLEYELGFVKYENSSNTANPNDGASLKYYGSGGTINEARMQQLNLIVFYPEYKHKFDAFKEATDYCRSIGGPPNKAERVAIFEMYKRKAEVLHHLRRRKV